MWFWSRTSQSLLEPSRLILHIVRAESPMVTRRDTIKPKDPSKSSTSYNKVERKVISIFNGWIPRNDPKMYFITSRGRNNKYITPIFYHFPSANKAQSVITTRKRQKPDRLQGYAILTQMQSGVVSRFCGDICSRVYA